MSRIDNPNADKPFNRVDNDEHGNELYGYRVVDGLEEIVHIPSGRSNMSYHRPELVLNPTGCKHEFEITSVGFREIECVKCHFGTTFHPGLNFEENAEGMFVTLKGKTYRVA